MSGTLKLDIIHKVLHARATHPALFAKGSYRPLSAYGPRAASIFAFARIAASSLADAAIIVVPRLTHAFAPDALPVADLWRETDLHLDARTFTQRRWRCAISARELTFPLPHSASAPTIRLPLSELFALAPAALLIPLPEPLTSSTSR